jgi:hypothetical protein
MQIERGRNAYERAVHRVKREALRGRMTGLARAFSRAFCAGEELPKVRERVGLRCLLAEQQNQRDQQVAQGAVHRVRLDSRVRDFAQGLRGRP